MTTPVLSWPEIEARLATVDLVGAMHDAFAAYSRGEAEIPPVGELVFKEPPGDVHIKYGYLRSGAYYVVKIASGFYNNPALGLSSCQGMMLLFDQRTGVPACILLDEGKLTDARTGAAGALAAAKLAPKDPSCIGVVGTGIQARVQLEYLRGVTTCRDVAVWGRDLSKARACARDLEAMGYRARPVEELEVLAGECRLIVTTTPSAEPLLRADWISPGTHITAMGSDTSHKQELEAGLLARAELLVVDSREQSRSRGEVHQARQAGVTVDEKLRELGDLCQPDERFERDPKAITIADLTGVAVQDLAAAIAVAQL